MTKNSEQGQWSIVATLLATVFSGLAPILGKWAYQAGVTPTVLVAVRTATAAGLLWFFYLLFWRQYIAISGQDLLGCVGMGVANGVGSLLYYTGLSRVDASLAHLLYSMYPFWVFIFLSAAGHAVSRLALLRLGLALLSVFLLTWQGAGLSDSLGIALMIGAGALYGFHLVLGQWTLADVKAQTVTLYALTTMAVVVSVPLLTQGRPPAPISTQGWLAILLVAIFPTALARLLTFAGLSRLGGVQSALLGIAEPLVALVLAMVLLGETFTVQQWVGALAFAASFFLLRRDTGMQLADEDAWWRTLFPEPLDDDGTGGAGRISQSSS